MLDLQRNCISINHRPSLLRGYLLDELLLLTKHLSFALKSGLKPALLGDFQVDFLEVAFFES